MTVDFIHIPVGQYATIWSCYTCNSLFDSEICNSFTGECYECYPRPTEMKE